MNFSDFSISRCDSASDVLLVDYIEYVVEKRSKYDPHDR